MLNRPARQVLDAFAAPAGVADAAARLTGLAERDVRFAARSLQLAGLLFPVQAAAAESLPQTLTVWLHVTNDCNLRCAYCYLDKTRESMSLETGLQAVEAAFRSALRHNFQRVKLKYAGGEPTLAFKTVAALQEHALHLAAESGLELDEVILSNGTRFSPRMIAEIQRLNLRLSISLDGIGAAHDAQRAFPNQRGSFDALLRSLDRLAQAGVTPSVTVTLSARNLDGLPETVAFLLERGLPFTLNFYRENACSTGLGDLRFSDEAVIAAMQRAFAVIEANLPPFSLLGSLSDRARLDLPHDRPCGVGQSYLVVGPRGNLSRCHMQMERVSAHIAAEDPLDDLRRDTAGLPNPSVDDKPGCNECPWRYACAGGCPLVSYRATGRYDGRSPNCNIYRALFPEILRLEGLRILKQAAI